MSKKLPVTRSLACVVLGSFMLAGCGSYPETSASKQSETTTVTTTVAAQTAVLGSIEDRAGGASIDGDRRSWTDPFLGIDDAQHAVPGRYSTELFGTRPVWTPLDPLGDLPNRDDLEDGMNKCDDQDPVLGGKTQIQYVKARYLVVNDEAGPTSMKDAIPSGYAHSVDGAVIAALNQVGYGFPDRSDEVGDKVTDALWATSASINEELPKVEDWPQEPYFRPRLSFPMQYYRIVNCSEDVVVVQVGFDETADEPSVGAEIPLFWRDGDWHADFTGTADMRLNNTPGVDQWPNKVEVNYS